MFTPEDYTGYAVLFDSRLKPCKGYRIQDGYFDGFTYTVKEVTRYAKARPTMELNAEIPEVVIQGYYPSGSGIVWFSTRSEVAPVMLMEPLGGSWGYNGNTLVPIGGIGSTGTPGSNPEKRDLTVDEKSALDKAKEAVKEKGCGANMAYELVSANWNRYSFKVDPDLKGQAGYLNGTFYFKNAGTIDARYFKE